LFRYWETFIANFEIESIAACSCEIKTASDVAFTEGFRLRYKFHKKPIHNIDTNKTENEYESSKTAINYVSIGCCRYVWLCNGDVLAEISSFIYGPPPFLFADVVHTTVDDPNSEGIVQFRSNFHDLQRSIRLGSYT
jgi:hypothetical protein